MLPGVAPTGRPVSVAFVVIVGVENGKIAYEHIYWDQLRRLDPPKLTGTFRPGSDGSRRPQRSGNRRSRRTDFGSSAESSRI
jgi:hypothetical protein